MKGQTVQMLCQYCSKEIPAPSSFRTPDGLRLYMITGQCQTCQDASTTTAILMRAYVRASRRDA